MTVPPPRMIVSAQGASSTSHRFALASACVTVTRVPAGSSATVIVFWMPVPGSTGWVRRTVPGPITS